MNEMFNYIFSNMKASEKNIKAITKTLKRQRRFNSGLIFVVTGTAITISVMSNHIKEQNDKIKKLEKRIDEMTISDEEKEFVRGE